MKRIIVLISLLCALSAAAQKPASITVMSYNIRNGEAKDGTNSWQYRYPTSAMMVDDQSPDIMGVQEAYLYQVQYLDEYCKGYSSVGVGREDGKKEGEHMSIFYNTKRIKLIKWGTFWLSDTPDKPTLGWDAACKRTATWALMQDKASKQKFYVVNTHLDHVGVEARKKGLELIASKIEEINSGDLPIVVIGDFNMTPDAPELSDFGKVMKSARATAFSSDRTTPTYNAWGKSENSSIIDHIYYKGFSSCTVFEVVTKPYADRKFISDHYPVKATLIL